MVEQIGYLHADLELCGFADRDTFDQRKGDGSRPGTYDSTDWSIAEAADVVRGNGPRRGVEIIACAAVSIGRHTGNNIRPSKSDDVDHVSAGRIGARLVGSQEWTALHKHHASDFPPADRRIQESIGIS